MARIAELFVIVNAVAGIATFLGVRFIWKRSKDKAKRGLEIIHVDQGQEDDALPEVPTKALRR